MCVAEVVVLTTLRREAASLSLCYHSTARQFFLFLQVEGANCRLFPLLRGRYAFLTVDEYVFITIRQTVESKYTG